MSTRVLLPLWGDGGADVDWDWDWESAREMNQSRLPRRQCCLRDASRGDDDDDEGAPVAWIGLAEGPRAAIDGDGNDDDDGFGVVTSDVWWRVSLLL